MFAFQKGDRDIYDDTRIVALSRLRLTTEARINGREDILFDIIGSCRIVLK
jgi:hypothetical protein